MTNGVLSLTMHIAPCRLCCMLVMEHLAVALRSNPDIYGITVGPKQHKLALYADDLLLYLTDPLTSLPNIFRKFERFGHLSNFKVNYSKTEDLNITFDDATVKHLTEVLPFKWQDSSIKYLGTHITKNMDNVYKLNFLPILNCTLTE